MDAYKCDGCKALFEGESVKHRDLDLGEFMVRFLVARQVEPAPKEELPEGAKQGVVIMPPELKRMMGMEEPEMHEGKELHVADLCSDCALDLFKRALVRAQADDIVAQLVTDGEEFRD